MLNTQGGADYDLLRRTAIRSGLEGWLGNELAQRHSKVCMDVSGLISQGNFGGISLFDGTLDAAL